MVPTVAAGLVKCCSSMVCVCVLTDAIWLAELIASGRIKVNVETILPLREARKAQELSQSGHAHGKIVLAVTGDAGMVL